MKAILIDGGGDLAQNLKKIEQEYKVITPSRSEFDVTD